MCGRASGIRIFIFCFTFGVGVFVSNTFTPKDLPVKDLPSENIKPNAETVPEKKCVPVDKNLKYENLSVEKPEFSAEPGKADLKPLAPEKKNETNKSKKPKPESKPQPHIPGKDPIEFQNLMHVEKCFETS